MDDVRVWRISAGESEGAQRRAAGFLAERGLRAGDRVALSVPTSADLLAMVLGAARAGVVPVVLNPALLPDERARLVADADPTLVVDDARVLCEALAGGPAVEISPHPLTRPMHYTSGTTGAPKGVWSGLLGEDGARRLFEDERDLWAFSSADVLMLCSPLHHSAPIRFAASTLLSGGEVVLLERFDRAAVVRAIEEHRPTAAFVVPSHLQRLFAAGAALPDTSSFRLLAHAGEPCPPVLKHRAMESFPDGAVWEFYGSTEGQFTVCSPAEWSSHPGSVGRARPQRRIEVDPDGQIWCSVPAWARFEYWRDPEKTAAAWSGDAFTVGDLGRLSDGYLYIDGRRDDLIISGGVNVYPAEVEQALSAVDGIVELAAFGVTDERWGQRVCLAVVGDAPDDELLAAARASLAPYKRPKGIYRVDALPRTGTGKLRRSAISGALGLE